MHVVTRAYNLALKIGFLPYERYCFSPVVVVVQLDRSVNLRMISGFEGVCATMIHVTNRVSRFPAKINIFRLATKI